MFFFLLWSLFTHRWQLKIDLEMKQKLIGDKQQSIKRARNAHSAARAVIKLYSHKNQYKHHNIL